MFEAIRGVSSGQFGGVSGPFERDHRQKPKARKVEKRCFSIKQLLNSKYLAEYWST